MLIYQGVSDPIFSAVDLRDWYQKVQQAVENPQNFAKLFFVPAMNHCRRGETINDFDMLTTLENWVEKGTSPEQIIAKAGELYPNKENSSYFALIQKWLITSKASQITLKVISVVNVKSLY